MKNPIASACIIASTLFEFFSISRAGTEAIKGRIVEPVVIYECGKEFVFKTGTDLILRGHFMLNPMDQSLFVFTGHRVYSVRNDGASPDTSPPIAAGTHFSWGPVETRTYEESRVHLVGTMESLGGETGRVSDCSGSGNQTTIAQNTSP